MRLLRLSLEGFGVYDDPLFLDFTALPQNALYLIHGPTGGGKSMLLDAICFALFDETATSERKADRLRSDHAAPTRETRVVLDFALREKAYRIERSPAFQRPAQRGDKLVNQAARVAFYQLADEQEGSPTEDVLGQRKKEVDERIVDLLGIDGVQFRQLVIIPQGRFREILTANSAERERMMAALFRTDRLERLQRFLKERSTAVQVEIRAQRERRQTMLQGLQLEHEREIDQALTEVRAEGMRLSEVVTKAKAFDQEARQRLQDAKERNHKLEILNRAKTALAKLESQRPHHQANLNQREQARQLQTLDVPFSRLAEIESAVETQRKRQETGAQRCRSLAGQIAQATSDRAGLEGEASDLLARIEQQVVRDRQSLEAALKLFEETDQQWRAGRAGLLAQELADGEPCPVCGSPDHPAPASLDAGTPDDSRLEEVRSQVEDARAKHSKRQRTAEAYSERLKSLEVDFSAGPIATRFSNPAQLLERLQEIDATLEKLRRDQAIAENEATATAKQIEELQDTASQNRSELEAALSMAGFASLEAAQAKRLDPDAFAALEQRIGAFERQLIETRTRLAAAGAEAPDGEPVDLAPFETTVHDAETARDNALRQEEANTIKQRRLVEGKEALAKLAEDLDELEQRYAVDGRIAALANGEGGAERITFQRFVLAALLDEALDAASQRLRLMSRNRYLLRRTRTATDRRQVAGLDLEVDDAYTGRSRPVGTLSGGESFLASLALALGMADVIASHAGGIRLDTMFIDEGFGSLDPEALDLALRALIDLRQEGRTIGIVSHVPELKERIDYRLEVKATSKGSRAAFVLP